LVSAAVAVAEEPLEPPTAGLPVLLGYLFSNILITLSGTFSDG
jgi:hypothetical protein